MHFWQVQTRFFGGTSCPVKYGFNGAMPALIKSRLLSLCGTREKLGIAKCSLLSKNSRKLRRKSLTFVIMISSIFEQYDITRIEHHKS